MKKTVLISCMMLCLFSTVLLMGLPFDIQQVRAEPRTWTVDDDGLADFHTIQEAIDASSSGDTVIVKKGTYNQNLEVDESISLIGEDVDTTIVNGSILVNANNITIRGFSILGRIAVSLWSSPERIYYNKIMNNKIAGIDLYNAYNTTISNNTGTGGVYLQRNSSYNLISENTISGGLLVLEGEGASPGEYWGYNEISYNRISSTRTGIKLHTKGNIVQENNIANSTIGIECRDENIILDNIVTNNTLGILGSSYMRDNTMEYNQFNFYGWEGDIDTSNTVDGKSVYCLVNRSDLVLDESTTPSVGYISLSDCVNVTVRNLNLVNNAIGIYTFNSNSTTIVDNDIESNIFGIGCSMGYSNTVVANSIRNNVHGISLIGGENNSILGNVIVNNTYAGRTLQLHYPLSSIMYRNYLLFDEPIGHHGGLFVASDNNTISDNIIEENGNGIFMAYSSFNVLRNNSMTRNRFNFGLHSCLRPVLPETLFDYFINDVDSSNTVDGKPIYYWMNQHSRQVPEDAGCVVLVNSTDITMRDLVLEGNHQGIFLVATNNTSISSCTIQDCMYGIYMKSGACDVEHNNISNNIYGLYLDYCYNNRVFKNVLSDNGLGIFVRGSRNEIFQNTLTNHTNPYEKYPRDPHGSWSHYYIGSFPIGYGIVGAIAMDGDDNIFHDNIIKCNYYGLMAGPYCQHGGEHVFHNNFIKNAHQVWVVQWDNHACMHTWDDDYPSGGNHWSDYTDVDLHSGPYQNETGSDGIWDHSYIIDENNVDRYPLVEPILTRRFDPRIDGFGFGNYGLQPECLSYTFKEVYDRLTTLPDFPAKFPAGLLSWIVYLGLIEAHEKGHCGGMSLAAMYYYNNPTEIPASKVYDIKEENRSLVAGIIDHYQTEQFFDLNLWLKHILTYFGDDPTGLLSTKQQLAWFEEQSASYNPTKLTILDPEKYGFFWAHAMVAHCYNSTNSDHFILFYNPNEPYNSDLPYAPYNPEEAPNLWLYEDNGDFWIELDQSGFECSKFYFLDAPTSLDWSQISDYMIDELISIVIEEMKKMFPRMLLFTLSSPAELHVYDPYGNHVGSTTNGKEIEFNALYCASPEGVQYLAIPDPADGNYSIEIVGTNYGPYNLTQSWISEGITIAQNSTFEDIDNQTTFIYSLQLSEGQATFTESPVSLIKLFEAGTWDSITYCVHIFSNSSTISNWNFSQIERKICFNVEGRLDTVGFCNVTIPVSLLGGPYSVRIDDTTRLEDWSPPTNGTHAFLYFVYDHSIHTIEITGTTAIPEFPSFLILPLFILSTLLAAILYGRKHSV